MSLLKHVLLFLLGGGSYTALELCWRGRSHISMFFLGGACFHAIGQLHRRLPRASFLVKMVLGSLLCTLGELLTGLLVNRDHHVWDYRELPLNFLGQICLPFSLLWMPLSYFAGILYRGCRKWMGL